MEIKADIKVPTPINSEGVPSVGMPQNIMSPMANVNTPNSVPVAKQPPPQMLTPTSVPYQSPQQNHPQNIQPNVVLIISLL